MKNIIFFLVSFFCLISMQNTAAQETLSGKWQATFKLNFFGELRTRLYIEQQNTQTFTAHSHKNGVKNLVGGFKAAMAKTFSKSIMMKTGAFCNITNGKIEKIGDTTKIVGIFITPMTGASKIKAVLKNGELVGQLLDKNGKSVGSIVCKPSDTEGVLDDYPKIIRDLDAALEAHIYDKKALKMSEYLDFKKKMTRLSHKAIDDFDIIAGFYTSYKKLPFSHANIFRPTEKPTIQFETKPNQITLEEKTPQTALMTIKSFYCSAADMDSIMQIVMTKNYPNLIIDLRDNTGGSLEGGIALSKYLVKKETPTGVYLTQKWFNNRPTPPNESELLATPSFTKANVQEFLNELDEKGIVVLKTTPGQQFYSGKIYMLINGVTGSACEPTAWNLKHSGRATLVGETTSGAMLSANSYPVSGGFWANIPNADYYTPTGERLDKIGVQPNVKVPSAQALDYVLNLVK